MGEEMNRRLLTVILILLLLVSWVVIIDLARDKKNREVVCPECVRLTNALKIAEDFIDESRDEIDDMSNQIDTLIEDLKRGNAWNEEIFR
jgi:hypothetical protein